VNTVFERFELVETALVQMLEEKKYAPPDLCWKP